MLRKAIGPLAILAATPGLTLAQHCMDPRVVAGEAEMVYGNIGNPTTVWLEIDRDSVGAEPAGVFRLKAGESPQAGSEAEYQVPSRKRAIVRVPVGSKEYIWLSPVTPVGTRGSGSAGPEPRPGNPTPALRYRICFRD